jgi:hypothetical protein
VDGVERYGGIQVGRSNIYLPGGRDPCSEQELDPKGEKHKHEDGIQRIY